MSNEQKFISKEKIGEFINSIKGEKFIPQKKEDYFVWSRYNGFDKSNPYIDGFRPTLSPKFFFYSPQENLKDKQFNKRAVIGIKACDLRGIIFLKKVFKEGVLIDPFFRDDILIISSDCTFLCDSCFCALLGDTPYPDKDFDINLSELEDGYVVEIGSEKGKKLVEEYNQFFSSVTSEKLDKMRNRREKVKKAILEKSSDATPVSCIRELRVKSSDATPVSCIREFKIQSTEKIKDEINKCVSCAACTNVCPSCFCFLLGELSNMEGKIRFWDSCQQVGYARVAGGANPNKELNKRFIHRVKCKFEYSQERFGSRGCFGCGRCIVACHGGIDFKELIVRSS